MGHSKFLPDENIQNVLLNHAAFAQFIQGMSFIRLEHGHFIFHFLVVLLAKDNWSYTMHFARMWDNYVMTLYIGDKVRSQGGVEGEVIALNEDGRSVMVKVPGDWAGTGVVSIPIVRLMFIERHAPVNPNCDSKPR